MQRLDRNLLLQSKSVGGLMGEALWAQRLSGDLLGVFGALALVLAAIGIYGVVSYSVNRRVRVALGATPAGVQMMILTEGIRLVAIGVAAGMLIARIGSRAVEGMLFAASPRDAAPLCGCLRF